SPSVYPGSSGACRGGSASRPRPPSTPRACRCLLWPTAPPRPDRSPAVRRRASPAVPSGGVTLCRAGGATSGRVLGREQPDDAREPTTESVAPVREERLVLAGTARQPGDRDARRLQLLDHAGGDVDRRGAGA